MSESSGSIWERIVAWFRGKSTTSAGQDGAIGSRTGSFGSLKDTASKAAGSARDAAAQAADRARSTVDDFSNRAQSATGSVSDRASGAVGSAQDRAQGAVDSAASRVQGAADSVRSGLSGAAASVTGRGYDTGSASGTAAGSGTETSDATAEDMDAAGQANRGPVSAGGAGAGTGMTAEDLDQGGPDTAQRGSATGGFTANDVTSERNAPAEAGQGITYSPSPAEHPEADQTATDVGTSGRPFADAGDDWWDTDRPGMGTGSSLGEQGAGSETGTEGSGGGRLGASASAADVGTSTTGARSGGVDASGSGTGATSAGTDTGAGTSTSETFTGAGGSATATGAQADVVGGYGESGTGTADTSSTGVDSPATAPGVGYAGSSPATGHEGVGSYAPSAATGGGTGASSDDANLVQEAPSETEARSADQADAALAGTRYDQTDVSSDANAATTFDATPDNVEDYSTAQGIVVGGLIAEDQEETGGEYSDEILVDAETQQAELPAADYADLPTDTASTTEGGVTTSLGDQTTPAPPQASMTGTTGHGVTPDTAQGSEDAYEAAYGAPREADVGAGADTGAGTDTGGTATSEQVDVNAPTVGVRGVNWVPGDGGTVAPEGFPLKGNASSMIYHPRESSTYERTIAEYYFATPADAEAAGYRLPKSLQNNAELTGDAGRGTAVTASTANQTGARTSGQRGGASQTGGKQERPVPRGAIRSQGASCPDDHPIKGNANSRIYHMPSESSYEQTIPEFCFATEADAKAAGFRARKH